MDATHRRSIGNLYQLEDRRLARLPRTANASGVPTPREQALERLSVREVAVLQLVANGFTNREIGVSLSISEETVKSHVKMLLSKLHCTQQSPRRLDRDPSWPHKLNQHRLSVTCRSRS